ncbi:MAG TPA: PAS domain S-box protein [Kiritimatiellia bacterium]|nr:PAS domain S-box protein [Kiritimatiellia bacterium]HRZ11921.1 PAS domain S-box protein [Kiritimatiellia bacterium]HSA17273.1 PAS domain S-box protein [Kiritimatiellia bacterium]
MKTASRIRILFAEDVPADVELAQRELRRGDLDFESRRVETEEDYLKALDEFRPDVVISDYSMPRFNGMKALQLALRRDPRPPLILLTGSLNEETAVQCMKAGAADYVLKDNMTRLPFAVKEALQQRESREAQARAEASLRESEEKFSIAFQTSPYAITITRPEDGRFMEVNDGFCSITGYRREEVLGRSSLELGLWTRAEDRSSVVDTIRRGEVVDGVEFPFRVKSGDLITGLFSARIINLRGEKFVLSSINDITDRKQAEEKLRQQLNELRRWQSATLGREGRVIELKAEVNELLKRLGEKPRYGSGGGD